MTKYSANGIPYRCVLDLKFIKQIFIEHPLTINFVLGVEITAENKKVKFPPLV